ncbi:MAG TPA: hypothetical protein VMV92_24260 [Streptosporangiaceae bacterium]|nr:hypothetical protein [Streptosporangiaceae bacterium]HVB46228.1 hypothetical protein [Streptosporangiaceae bacterium]
MRPVRAQGVKVPAWLADGDPVPGDPVDPHVGGPGEVADGGTEVNSPAGVLGGDEQAEDRRPRDQPGDQGQRLHGAGRPGRTARRGRRGG